LRAILARAEARTRTGGIGVLLAEGDAAKRIVSETLALGLCSAEQTRDIEKALEKLRISAEAYRRHRARNVYNGAYSEWWNVAGRAWSRYLRTARELSAAT
jgi:hypothetical protein